MRQHDFEFETWLDQAVAEAHQAIARIHEEGNALLDASWEALRQDYRGYVEGSQGDPTGGGPGSAGLHRRSWFDR
ncbi:hypothetical protein LWP59_24515 [Amycolatopsis acidiphila]|uniref:Uncharacterized protein n=1 Tax=Amycolatopsis acidiphila TaxID=715473 RepID=A0A558AC99_9PSEU|nr:hypothetical protein [Amycolatopsis acidiphila]TVT21892.1 hypothetical protein FNH06_15135 [Amycolatopsis acidiphila]UIJ57309.1 hypothetical protein LWP59_24515 [Amycolatopsis acidiphila]GHG84898.1 hypothetical protein GCM10017788_57380 [Amycolatopsis acidiphila]